jgi:EAL and modified HD-GYP domain-containing signal transduction protein
MRSQPIYLARQPIVDRNGELKGFELLFRSTEENAASADNNLYATSAVIVNAFSEIGLDQVVGDSDAYINVDNQFLFTDLVETLPADRVVLELLEHSIADERTIDRCRKLRQMGYRLAVDDFVGNVGELDALLRSVDMVKINFQRIDPLLIPEIVKTLRTHAVTLVAEKIETPDQFRHAKQLGIELFQGYHFAHPEMLSGRRERPAKLALLRLLALAMDEQETSAIEQEFKRHPTLSVNLIRLTNSAALRSRQCVTSLRHALILLGRRQLKVWLQLLLYTADRGNRSLSSPLLQLAAVRGKLMELIAARQSGPQGAFQDLAFMTGILSLMDVVFEMPQDEIVRELNLPAPVKDALLGRNGDLGQLLTLTEQLEQDDGDAVASSLHRIDGVDADDLVELQCGAFEWANQLVHEPGALPEAG